MIRRAADLTEEPKAAKADAKLRRQIEKGKERLPAVAVPDASAFLYKAQVRSPAMTKVA